jgi:hypothetical protein
MSPEMVVNFDRVRAFAGVAGCVVVVVVVVVVVGRPVVDDDTGAVVGDAAPDVRWSTLSATSTARPRTAVTPRTPASRRRDTTSL